MDIKLCGEGKTRIFELTLDRKDLQILGDLDSQGVISPYDPSGARFQLFPHPCHFSESFRDLSSSVGTYYAYVGGDIKTLEDLERLINSRGRIPIEMPSVIPDRDPITLGYVVLKVV